MKILGIAEGYIYADEKYYSSIEEYQELLECELSGDIVHEVEIITLINKVQFRFPSSEDIKKFIQNHNDTPSSDEILFIIGNFLIEDDIDIELFDSSKLKGLPEFVRDLKNHYNASNLDKVIELLVEDFRYKNESLYYLYPATNQIETHLFQFKDDDTLEYLGVKS